MIRMTPSAAVHSTNWPVPRKLSRAKRAGAAFSIRTSTCGMIFLSRSCPSFVSTLRVTESLFRASARNRGLHFSPLAAVNAYSSRPNGTLVRNGSPPGGSTMMTSAPSSEKWDEHQWPMIWFAVQSRTRSPSSDSGLSALNCCRTADSIHREYAFFFSSTPAYTSSVVGVGMAGHGRTLIFGRFFSVRHFSAILPLLKNFPDHSTLHYGKHGRHRALSLFLVPR